MFNDKYALKSAINRRSTILKSMFTPVRLLVFILIIISLWMASGIFKSKEKEVEIKQAVKVKVIESESSARNMSLQFNGVTKSDKSITLRPEVSGAVTKVFAKDGDFLNAGQIILKIDEENRKKLYQQALSELGSAKIQFKAARITYEKKFSSKNYLIEATSKLKMAEAGLESAQRTLEKTIVKAPFNGYLESIKVKEGDYVSNSIGSVMGQFSSMDIVIATIYASQSDLHFIHKASDATIINSNNLLIPGAITFIGRVADPATRTFPVEITVDNRKHLLRIGESITVELRGNSDEDLHYVPKSSLVLDSLGRISVKTLCKNGNVITKNIGIKDEDSNGFWISGLGKIESIITVGASFVAEGDKPQVE